MTLIERLQALLFGPGLEQETKSIPEKKVTVNHKYDNCEIYYHPLAGKYYAKYDDCYIFRTVEGTYRLTQIPSSFEGSETFDDEKAYLDQYLEWRGKDVQLVKNWKL